MTVLYTNQICGLMKDAIKGATLYVLSCQPRLTEASCFVYNVIHDLESIDHLCFNPIHRIGLIHK